MRIVTDFDPELMREYTERGRSPLITLYVEHGGFAYPETDWIDFGCIVLSWWLVAMIELYQNRHEIVLRFMDGPYGLHLVRRSVHVCISTIDDKVIGEATLMDLSNTIITAALETLAKLEELGLPDNSGLQQGVEALRKISLEN